MSESLKCPSQVRLGQPLSARACRFYSQSGNGGGTAGNVLYDYLTVDQNYNLVQHSASSSSPPRGLFALRIMKSGNLFLQFTDIFKNQTKTQRIPIVYQRNEVIELYNNGYPAPNPNAQVKHTWVNLNNPYQNTIPKSEVDALPTTQDMQNYEDFRDAINGDNNSISNEEIYFI